MGSTVEQSESFLALLCTCTQGPDGSFARLVDYCITQFQAREKERSRAFES